MLEYQVPTENLLLSQVFHKLELLRKTNSIEDYSVTQTTLDQVIICLFSCSKENYIFLAVTCFCLCMFVCLLFIFLGGMRGEWVRGGSSFLSTARARTRWRYAPTSTSTCVYSLYPPFTNFSRCITIFLRFGFEKSIWTPYKAL